MVKRYLSDDIAGNYNSLLIFRLSQTIGCVNTSTEHTDFTINHNNNVGTMNSNKVTQPELIASILV